MRRAIEVCASILDEPPAREATGRRPRILVDGEYQFFLEDMKTLGQKNRRLSGMLSFFFAQWSAFEDEEAWLRGEERAVLKHARTVLRQYGAMLRHEAPYLCGKLLSSKAGRPLAQRYDYVLCDDFQNLSRAEQVCLCLCARTQVVVCGNADQATHVNTDYPCPEGFEKFDRVRRGVDAFSLDGAFGIAQAVAFGEALRMAKRRVQEAKGASGAERARDAEGAQGEKAAEARRMRGSAWQVARRSRSIRGAPEKRSSSNGRRPKTSLPACLRSSRRFARATPRRGQGMSWWRFPPGRGVVSHKRPLSKPAFAPRLRGWAHAWGAILAARGITAL